MRRSVFAFILGIGFVLTPFFMGGHFLVFADTEEDIEELRNEIEERNSRLEDIKAEIEKYKGKFEDHQS